MHKRLFESYFDQNPHKKTLSITKISALTTTTRPFQKLLNLCISFNDHLSSSSVKKIMIRNKYSTNHLFPFSKIRSRTPSRIVHTLLPSAVSFFHSAFYPFFVSHSRLGRHIVHTDLLYSIVRVMQLIFIINFLTEYRSNQIN